MPDTPKTNHNNMKTWKKNKPKKHHSAMFKTTHYFSYIFCFSHTILHFEKLCFAENTITMIFFQKKKLFKNTISKTQFFNHVKNTFFKKKVSSSVLANFRWNPYFYSVFWFTLFWSKKNWPKQIVCTKMRVFCSPFLTQIVSVNFC